jgi:Acyl-CoA reductase (LuxC)
MSAAALDTSPPLKPVAVNHFIKGRLLRGAHHEFGTGRRFFTPELKLDELVWPRLEPGPAFDVPLAEILDLLEATGMAIARDSDGLISEAIEQLVLTGPLDRRILSNALQSLPGLFDRGVLRFMVRNELGDPQLLDGWQPVLRPDGKLALCRAFPPRMVQVIAGNSPGVAAASIIRGALTKGVSLIKLPSNDLFSATAILRIMAGIAPDHPIVRSFSAVYWRGGDQAVEARIFQPQYFDKLIAWGGESTIRNALKHVGPGFELISFDPKTSISFIGREAFVTDADLARVAELGAIDATHYNQQACVCSRVQFVEASVAEADRYAALLQQAMRKERPTAAACVGPTPSSIREEIEVLRAMEPLYRVWGGYEGEGLVIRSDEPVEFYPDGKVVNVVPVRSLESAVRYANVATKTVGIYPGERRASLRDALMSAGVQGVCTLGSVMSSMPGLPHDGYLPLNRFVRWVKDEE